MKKVAILINARSGSGSGPAAIQQARRALWGWPLEILAPASLEELDAQCARLSPSEQEGLVVVGGDGTAHQAIKAMRRARIENVPLLSFPGGTANDLAAVLEIRESWQQVQ